MRKLIALAAVSAVAAVGTVAGLAGTAAAADAAEITGGTGTIKLQTTSYTSPSQQSIPVHTNLMPGEQVETMCFREGQSLQGNSYWFLIRSDGDLGYVHRDAIAPPSDTQHC